MAKYPSLVFHFRVEWGGTSVSFTEVAGLTQELQAVDYRTGDSPDYSMVKMPGLRKYNNITLKRGIVKGDNELFAWLNTVKLNDIERRDITVSLLNEKHEPVMVWTAHNAFPVKVEGPGLKASGNEVAIESIEIAHEGLVLQNA
jgi:phage tail-like protein